MRSINTVILIFIFSIGFISSCESSKASQNISKNMIDKITLEKTTRGNSSQLIMTSVETFNSEMKLGGEKEPSKTQTSNNDWNKINQLVSKIDLNKIGEWEAPTQARMYDGALATTIIIESNGEIYNSQTFDEGKPPAELEELYNYLESLVNQ